MCVNWLTLRRRRCPLQWLIKPGQRIARSTSAGTFSTSGIHPYVTAALGPAVQRYTLGSLRYVIRALGAHCENQEFW